MYSSVTVHEARRGDRHQFEAPYVPVCNGDEVHEHVGFLLLHGFPGTCLGQQDAEDLKQLP